MKNRKLKMLLREVNNKREDNKNFLYRKRDNKRRTKRNQFREVKKLSKKWLDKLSTITILKRLNNCSGNTT